MTIILDNGCEFRITKIMGIVDSRPRPDAPLAGEIAIYFEPHTQSSVSSRGWWWLNRDIEYFTDETIPMIQKEKRLLRLMRSADNLWYEYSGKNDRHNADLIPQEKGE